MLVFDLLSVLFFVSSIAVPGESTSTASTSKNSITPYSIAAQSGLDVAAYREAPSGLRLEQVHIYFRHGARLPVGVYMTDPPASIPEHWLMCKASRQSNTPTTSFAADELEPAVTGEYLPMRKVVELSNGTALEGKCLLGELTDVGRQSTYSFGSALRRLYVENLGFLPDTLRSDSETYFRSTNLHRTIESLYQVMHGLYPTTKLGSGVVPSLLVRNGKDENLVANVSNCKRLENLMVQFAEEARVIYNDKLSRLDSKLSKYIGGNPIRLDGKPRAFGILDTIQACKAHDIKVPVEFEEKEVIELIEKAVVNERFGDIRSEEVRRLGAGKLFADFSQRLEDKAKRGEEDPLKILVHCTHDAGIALMASSLGVFDEKWPAFTSSITFELFSREEIARQSQSFLQSVFEAISPSKAANVRQHYIRMRYQNTDMHLPACAEERNHLPGHPEFCTFTAFQARMRELIPDDWEAACSTTVEHSSDAIRHWQL